MSLALSRKPAPLQSIVYESIVRAALAEDFGLGGDLTTEATVPAGSAAYGTLVARESGIIAGLEVARCAFALLDPAVRFDAVAHDGQPIVADQTLATILCDAGALLGAERTALNLLSHLSGIATATARYVAAVGDARCAIAETRKTMPGLRALQKYAVRAGGGANHRLRLDDGILIKDNHIALAGGIPAAIARARERAGHLVTIEIEVDTLEQLDAVLARAQDADVVLLDNFSLADTREAVRRIGGRLVVEASGGIRLADIPELARSGVDVISVGALTHSVVALDIGLDIGLDIVQPS